MLGMALHWECLTQGEAVLCSPKATVGARPSLTSSNKRRIGLLTALIYAQKLKLLFRLIKNFSKK